MQARHKDFYFGTFAINSNRSISVAFNGEVGLKSV